MSALLKKEIYGAVRFSAKGVQFCWARRNSSLAYDYGSSHICRIMGIIFDIEVEL